jgi:hypothetical protein
MAARSTSKISIESRDTTLIAGIKKRLSTTVAIIAAGVTYTPAALAALFQSQIDAIALIASTKAQWTAKVASTKALTLTVDQVYSALQTVLRTQYAHAPDALADFGMVPKKVSKRSPVTNVIAAARNLSTRQSRRTTGSKAKLAIHGTASESQIASKVAEAMGPTPPAAAAAPAATAGTPPPPAAVATTPMLAGSAPATHEPNGTRSS